MNKRTLLLLLSFSLITLTGCFKRNASHMEFSKLSMKMRQSQMMRGEAPISFVSFQKFILKPKCMSCHSGDKIEPEKDPIDFSSYESMMVEREAPLFITGPRATKSRLFKTLIHTNPKKIMPQEANALSEVEVEFVLNWIKACTPKDIVTSIPEKCPSVGDDDDDDDDDDDWGDDDDDDFESDEF